MGAFSSIIVENGDPKWARVPFWGGIGIRIVALHLSLSLVPVCAQLIPSFGFGFSIF